MGGSGGGCDALAGAAVVAWVHAISQGEGTRASNGKSSDRVMVISSREQRPSFARHSDLASL